MRGLTRWVAALVIGAAFGWFGPGTVLAAAPPNDTYRSATAISSLPFTQAIDLTEATDDPAYPPCEAGAFRRIWYTFTAPVSEPVRISVGGDPSAELASWKVLNGGPKGIQLNSCAVDGRDLITKLTAGAKYAFSVGQWTSGPPLIATLTIAVPPPPANDDFANAVTISSTPFEATIDQGSAAAATGQSGEPTPSCLPAASLSTVWYRYAPATATRVTWSLFAISTMGIYRGTSLSALTEIDCVDQGDSRSFDAAAGATYYFQIFPSASRDTVFDLNALVPPANDAFADALDVGTLPTTVSADLSVATVEPGEPAPSCGSSTTQTAWWSFTPSASGTLTAATGANDVFVAAYRGTSLGSLTEIVCMSFAYVPIKVTAGQPVELQLGFVSPSTGSGALSLSFQGAPSNDDFAAATPIRLGESVAVDLTGATVEPREANPPACAYWPGGSVWYDYTGTGNSVSFGLASGSSLMAIAAYSGSDLSSLTSLGCRLFDGPPLTIKPAAGQVVHLQVWSYDYCCGKSTTLSVATPASPSPQFLTEPGDPSSLDDITFIDQTQDPGGNPIASWSWNLGDAASSTDQYPVHRYAADGTYSVSLSVVTSDGRTGSATQSVVVRTHDVGIAKFMVPSTARSGQTRQIVLGIGNRHYPETVTVDLYVNTKSGQILVGSISKPVPVLGSGQTVDFAFDYTFTSADAAAGKVTFQAVANLTSARDAFPSDNLATSLATKVTR